MPDRRRRRGPHPKDLVAFSPEAVTVLRTATAELSWLLSRGYPKRAASTLVGNRHQLLDRQRRAVARCAAADQECRRRQERRLAGDLGGESLLVDGYNVLLTVEAAMSRGVLLLGRDGCLRDMAAMSRHYRSVEATAPALRLLGRHCRRISPAGVVWLLDRPISNSARLRAVMLEIAEAEGWSWDVHLSADPDRELQRSSAPVATSDSGILDACGGWYNLAREVVEERVDEPWVVDLSGV